MTSKLKVDEIVDSTDTGSPTFPFGTTTTNLSYTGTLTGGTGVINIGSGQVVKDANGNVGIGTSNPAQLLDLASSDPRINITDTDAGGVFQIRNTSGAGFVATLGSHPLIIATSGAERLRITSSGNVGIGTSTPLARLVVSNGSSENIEFSAGNATFNGGVVQYINRDSGTTRPDINYLLAGGGGSQKFFTNSAERARIDASGNLLVGTTSAIETFQGTTDGVSIIGSPGAIEASRNNGNVLELRRRSSNGDIVKFRRDTTNVGSISVTTTGTAYNTSSDYRLKEDAKPVLNPIDRLMQLKPINFAWKVDGSRTDGFLAHEAQAVVPEAVTGTKDAVDKDGKPVHQGIDQSKLVPLLTAALQDAIKRIEQLELQINSGA